MKKLAYTYITALTLSILVVMFLYNNLSSMINSLFFVILFTMLISDCIAKKSIKEIGLEGLLIGIVSYFIFTKDNSAANPYSLLPALLCMLISLYRTFKLIK